MLIENHINMVLAPCNGEKLVVTQYLKILFKIAYCKMLSIAFEIILQIAIKYLDICIICVILKLL